MSANTVHKLILLLDRRTDMTPAAFGEAWRDRAAHLPPYPARPQRHVHNRALDAGMPIENAPAATFDAVDELWFSDAATMIAWLGDGGAGADWLRGTAALLARPPLAIAGEARLIWEGDGATDDPVKIITLPVRRPGMTRTAFAQHWIEVHSALALEGPGTRTRLRRLEACPAAALPRPDLLEAAPFDGAGAIEFGRRADLATEFASDHYRDVMAPDEPRFTDPSRSCALMVEPQLLSG